MSIESSKPQGEGNANKNGQQIAQENLVALQAYIDGLKLENKGTSASTSVPSKR